MGKKSVFIGCPPGAYVLWQRHKIKERSTVKFSMISAEERLKKKMIREKGDKCAERRVARQDLTDDGGLLNEGDPASNS